MDSQGEKKKWVVPELLVLVRSRPEEAVLTACKFFSPTGPQSSFNGCALTNCLNTCELGAPS